MFLKKTDVMLLIFMGISHTRYDFVPQAKLVLQSEETVLYEAMEASSAHVLRDNCVVAFWRARNCQYHYDIRMPNVTGTNFHP